MKVYVEEIDQTVELDEGLSDAEIRDTINNELLAPTKFKDRDGNRLNKFQKMEDEIQKATRFFIATLMLFLLRTARARRLPQHRVRPRVHRRRSSDCLAGPGGPDAPATRRLRRESIAPADARSPRARAYRRGPPSPPPGPGCRPPPPAL